MHHLEGHMDGPRGEKIYYQAWLPVGEAKAVLLLLHGLGEHSGRYSNFVNFFVSHSFAVYAADHIGHGKSGGEREYVDNFSELISVPASYHQKVSQWQKGKPVFLAGHSLGGLIALALLLDHQEHFTGAILSAPAVVIPDQLNWVTILASRILSKVAPKLGVDKLKTHNLSRDPDVVRAYQEDPLVFKAKTPARMAAEGIDNIQKISSRLGEVSLPLLILQGSQDVMINPSASQLVYDCTGSADKTLRMYTGLYHEIFNEPEREQVFADILAWLEERI
jgi:acylglycerol lipase